LDESEHENKKKKIGRGRKKKVRKRRVCEERKGLGEKNASRGTDCRARAHSLVPRNNTPWQKEERPRKAFKGKGFAASGSKFRHEELRQSEYQCGGLHCGKREGVSPKTDGQKVGSSKKTQVI